MAIRIDKDLCENSGTCFAVCPEDVFEEKPSGIEVLNAGACTDCWICVDNCAASAVTLD